MIRRVTIILVRRPTFIVLHDECHESCPSAARSRVKARQTKISSLRAQGPHVGYVCSMPQIFITTDLRRADTTESRGRVYVLRGKSASSLCRWSRYEVTQVVCRW